MISGGTILPLHDEPTRRRRPRGAPGVVIRSSSCGSTSAKCEAGEGTPVPAVVCGQKKNVAMSGSPATFAWQASRQARIAGMPPFLPAGACDPEAAASVLCHQRRHACADIIERGAVDLAERAFCVRKMSVSVSASSFYMRLIARWQVALPNAEINRCHRVGCPGSSSAAIGGVASMAWSSTRRFERAVNLIPRGAAIANFASNTTRRVVGQWGGASGAFVKIILRWRRRLGTRGGLVCC